MSYSYSELTKLLPMDDLHWCSEDKKFVPLSEEELEKIIIDAHYVDLVGEDMETLMEVIRWCENARISHLLLKRVLSGNLMIIDIDPEKGPTFGAVERNGGFDVDEETDSGEES